ncbi:MAG: MraZ C-terminal domain-containing protein [Ancrocorticia sp.]|uniref:MraZ C-terminal domain-containing protein n=1 Tax=Ancrocorticia sp. TaxID=2593684 RepID=UPI003F916214
MRTTIDKAGRIVIPAQLREAAGLTSGPVDVILDGSGVRIEVPVADNVVEEDGLLLIDAPGETLTSADVREMRLASQR